MNYKEKLELMVKKIDILTRLKILQARDWDSPWYEGVYYGPLNPHPSSMINTNDGPFS